MPYQGQPGPDKTSTLGVSERTTWEPQTRREKRYLAHAAARDYHVMPNTHFVMILVGMIITLVFGTLYYFAPTEKAGFFSSVCLLAVGALFGKLSNQFGKPVKPFPAALPGVVDEDGDGIPDSEQDGVGDSRET
jgi:hypothetical protein